MIQQPRRGSFRWILRWWYVISLLALAGMLVVYADRRDLQARYDKYLQSKQTVQELQNRLDEYQREEQKLRVQVEKLHADPLEIEADFRQNKNLIREGETIYRIELNPEQKP